MHSLENTHSPSKLMVLKVLGYSTKLWSKSNTNMHKQTRLKHQKTPALHDVVDDTTKVWCKEGRIISSSSQEFPNRFMTTINTSIAQLTQEILNTL
jgi:hypothetical protein